MVGLGAALLERAASRERVLHELHVCNPTLGIDCRPYSKGRSLGDLHHAAILKLVPLLLVFKEGKSTGDEVEAKRNVVTRVEASNRYDIIPAHVREASEDGNVLAGAEEAFN